MVPESLIWILTPECNLKCKHCYTSRFNRVLYPKETYIKILDEIFELKIPSVGFTGGEPLLFPYISDLLEHSSGKVGKITIATNGTLLNKRWVELLRTIENLHLYISLDGLKKSHEKLRGDGTFQKALKGGKLVSEKGIPLHVMMAINKWNYTESGEVIKISADIGAESFSIIPVMPSGRAKENILPSGEEFLKAVELCLNEAEKLNVELDIWCAPFVLKWFSSHIMKVFLCRNSNIVDISPTLDLLLCDVIDIKLSNIVQEGSLKKALKVAETKDLPKPVTSEPCITCPLYEKCMGGCYARAFTKSGSLDAPDPLCPTVERRNTYANTRRAGSVG